jgi:hypothetical protein
MKGKTMFKKMFMLCLSLLLALNLGLQVTPALAQDGSATPGTGFQPVVPVQIKNVSLLTAYFAHIQVNGTLPASCYELKVSEPRVGKPNPETAVTLITIQLRGVWKRGTICKQQPKRFSTTVTINPLKLHLAPGRYLVRFNPVNGQTHYKVWITIPRGLQH